MMVHPKPDSVRVVIDGREVGLMEWAQDGSAEVIVYGETIVVPLAQELANLLGAKFHKD
jgi:hypothetical protein